MLEKWSSMKASRAVTVWLINDTIEWGIIKRLHNESTFIILDRIQHLTVLLSISKYVDALDFLMFIAYRLRQLRYSSLMLLSNEQIPLRYWGDRNNANTGSVSLNSVVNHRLTAPSLANPSSLALEREKQRRQTKEPTSPECPHPPQWCK